MGSLSLSNLADLFPRQAINVSSDPRVGSARDNATSTSALKVTTGSNSASFQTLFMTFIPVAIYAAVCWILFVILRKLYPRVYAPRTFLSSLAPHERTEPLPSGWLNWLKAFYNEPDTTVLNRSSLDGYLFLRFLKILCVITGVGAILTWTVLIPLHRYGGSGGEQLDLLTFGNVSNPTWYYAHALMAWVYFGFILYMISRECVYFVNLRQAYILSPYYASRLSSKTVLFTCVPRSILEERKLRKVFGDSVKNVWIPRETEELDRLVRERDQTATRLEKAEIVLIKKANEAYHKALKHGHPDIEGRWSQDLKEVDISFASTGGTSPRPSMPSKEMDTSVERTISSPTSIRPSIDPVQPKEPDMGIVSMISSATSIRPSIDPVQPTEPDIGIVSMISSPTSIQEPIPSKPQETTTVEFLSSPQSEFITSPRSFLRSDGTPHHMTSYGPFGPPPEISGSVAAQWIPHSWRPVHRPLANFGRRVDTIKWTRNQLKDLAPKISKLRRQHKKGQTVPIPAAFIEFDSQANAQSAYQTLAHHRANHMVPEIVGVRPEEIVWKSLRMHWWERIIRRFLVQGFIAAMVIFWSIPAAIIGSISNVQFLTSKIFFLGWINDLPKIVLGLIEGLLPAVALSMLMAAVPFVMRWCARQAGVPTLSRIELFTQNSYFIFQVVQVFLVTTITSAASAAFTQILENPMEIRELLSENLPKASNFYVSYFILQGLAMSSTRIVHLMSLFRVGLMAHSGKNPRMMWKRYHRLRVIHWGAVYPVFTNMGVIAISYSLIAPIIVGFAFIGLLIIYTTYRYNLLYVYSSEISTRGLHYPRALKHILTGVYLAEICMIGLFGLKSAFGPLILIIGLLIFTILLHMSLNASLSPLLYNLPRTLAIEEELHRAGRDGLDDIPEDEEDIEGAEGGNVYDSDFDPGAENDVDHDPNPTTRGLRLNEGVETLAALSKTGLKTFLKIQYNKTPLPTLLPRLDFWSYWLTPDPNITNPNILLKFLHPEIFADYSILRKSIPEWKEEEWGEGEGETRDAFYPPSVRSRAPRLWVPRDEAGVSKQECRHSGRVVGIGDEGAWIDEKGVLSVDLEGDRREGWEKIKY